MQLLLRLALAGSVPLGLSLDAASPRSGSPRTGAAPIAAFAAADTVREYRGSYETGFEVSWFHPCDAERGDDTWWVTLTDDALRQRDSLAAKLPSEQVRTVFVRWRGTTSIRMRAGHMGRGTRYMLVHEVLDLRPDTGAGCATASAPDEGRAEGTLSPRSAR